MKNRRKLNTLGITVIFLVSTLLSGCLSQTTENTIKEEIEVQAVVIEEEVEVEPVKTATSLRIIAAGDNLIHDNIYAQASRRAGGVGFDFTLPYENIANMIDGADIAFINQETPLAQDIAPLAGYPFFNSPDEVGHELERIGFNVINYANNHMIDKGVDGLLATMDFWEKKPDILHMGAWRSETEKNTPIIFEKNDIKVGFVAAAEHTNGLVFPADSPVSYLSSYDIEGMKKQVELTKANSDFVVLSIHWGTENSTDKNSNQIALSALFADWGVDLVLGHHSHTVQPIEWVEGKDGHKMLIAYSLGNFLHSMSNPQNMLGAMLDLTITKEPDSDKATITSAEMRPIINHYDGATRSNLRIIPYEEYTYQLANNHGVMIEFPYFGLEFCNDIITKNIPIEFRENLIMEWS